MLAGVWDAKNTNDSIDMCDMCCFFLQSLTKNRDLSPTIIGATVGKVKNPAIMMGLDGKSWRLYVSFRPAKNNHYGDYPGLDGDITSLQ